MVVGIGDDEAIANGIVLMINLTATVIIFGVTVVMMMMMMIMMVVMIIGIVVVIVIDFLSSIRWRRPFGFLFRRFIFGAIAIFAFVQSLTFFRLHTLSSLPSLGFLISLLILLHNIAIRESYYRAHSRVN